MPAHDGLWSHEHRPPCASSSRGVVRRSKTAGHRACRRGRLVARFTAISCCRSARFSSTSSRCPRSPSASARPTTINNCSISRTRASDRVRRRFDKDSRRLVFRHGRLVQRHRCRFRIAGKCRPGTGRRRLCGGPWSRATTTTLTAGGRVRRGGVGCRPRGRQQWTDDDAGVGLRQSRSRLRWPLRLSANPGGVLPGHQCTLPPQYDACTSGEPRRTRAGTPRGLPAHDGWVADGRLRLHGGRVSARQRRHSLCARFAPVQRMRRRTTRDRYRRAVPQAQSSSTTVPCGTDMGSTRRRSRGARFRAPTSAATTNRGRTKRLGFAPIRSDVSEP